MKSPATYKQSQRNEADNGTEHLIQERAYELFLKRGQQPGHELEDWLQAEREVKGSQEKLRRG
jgi:Protein of unknown function (DUF2934)